MLQSLISLALIATFQLQPKLEVPEVAFDWGSMNGRYLSIVSAINGVSCQELRVWDVKSEKVIARLPGKGTWSRMRTDASRNDDELFVVDSESLLIWRFDAERVQKRIRVAGNIMASAVSRDGRSLVISKWWEYGIPRSGLLEFWETATPSRTGVLRGRTVGTAFIRLLKDEERMLLCDLLGHMWVVEVGTQKVLFDYTDPHGLPSDIVVGAEDRVFLVGSGEKGREIHVLDLHEGRVVKRFTGHAGTAMHAAASADGKYLITAGREKSVCIWSLIEWKPLWYYVERESDYWANVKLQLVEEGKVLLVGRTLLKQVDSQQQVGDGREKCFAGVTWWDFESAKCLRAADIGSVWRNRVASANPEAKKADGKFEVKPMPIGSDDARK
jgi:WD40 repeat protein